MSLTNRFPRNRRYCPYRVTIVAVVSLTLNAIGMRPAHVMGQSGQPIQANQPDAGNSENEDNPPSFTVENGVRFAKPEGKSLRADIYIPTGEGPFPGILMIHGGGWRGGTKAQMTLHARMAAERGYAVMSINYRLAPRFKFPAQIHDCKTALRWWRERANKYRLDAERVATYGYSAGGHLACLMGVTDLSHGLEGGPDHEPAGISTQIQAVVAGGAPCDFRMLPPEAKFLSYWLGGTRSEKPKEYQLASPLAAVSPDDPPAFFFHGAEDWLVPSHSPESMHHALLAAGVRSEIYYCSRKGHIGAMLDRSAISKALDFVDGVMKTERN